MRLQEGLVLGVGMIAATALWQSRALADTSTYYQSSPAPAPVAVETTRTVYAGPNPALMGTGLVLFGGPYVASVIVGATSGHVGDDKLYIPVAGPWLDYGERGGCPLGSTCNAETGYKVLLAADGIAQGIGVIAILASLVVPETRTIHTYSTTGKADRSNALKPTVHFTPASYHGGAGLAAFGTF